MLSEMEGDGEYRRLAIACDLPVSPSWRGRVNTKRMYSIHFTSLMMFPRVLVERVAGRRDRVKLKLKVGSAQT
jgi:hypothetical protein